MRRKLRLDVDRLAVESFIAEEGADGTRGTVRAAQEERCTEGRSCLCQTAFYWCYEYDYTDYSCDGGSGYPTDTTCSHP